MQGTTISSFPSPSRSAGMGEPVIAPGSASGHGLEISLRLGSKIEIGSFDSCGATADGGVTVASLGFESGRQFANDRQKINKKIAASAVNIATFGRSMLRLVRTAMSRAS